MAAEPTLAHLDNETGSVRGCSGQSPPVTRPTSDTISYSGGSHSPAGSGGAQFAALAHAIPWNVAGRQTRTQVLPASPRILCVYSIVKVRSNCRKWAERDLDVSRIIRGKVNRYEPKRGQFIIHHGKGNKKRVDQGYLPLIRR